MPQRVDMKDTDFQSLAAISGWKRIKEAPEKFELSKVSDGDWFDEHLVGDEVFEFRKTGKITVQGHVAFPRTEGYTYWIVDGDMKVDGVLSVDTWDEASVLVVAGNLIANAVYVGSEAHLYVLGDLTVNRAIISNISDAGGFRVVGEVTCPLIVSQDREPDFEVDEWGSEDELDADLKQLVALCSNRPIQAPI